MPPFDLPWEVLDRYLTGTSSAAERALIEQWMAEHPNAQAELQAITAGVRMPALARDVTDVDVKQVLLAAGVKGEPAQTAVIEHKTTVPRRMGWVWAAGAMAAAAGLLLAVWPHVRVPMSPEYATAAGQRRSVTLRDGTTLLLGPESKLDVPSDFGRSTRTVMLEGEAYFSVVHDETHPFAVLSHNVKVTDVGTEFDVRGYDDDIRVAVTRGNVLVGAGRGNGAMEYARHSMNLGTVSRTRPTPPSNTPSSFQDISLSAGDMIDVVNGVTTVTHHVDIASATIWRQGGLAFHNTALASVVRDVARTFNLRITVADSSLLDQPVTATFQSESANEVLQEITFVVGARFERVGSQVVIRRKSTGNSDATHVPPLQTARE